MKQPSLASSDAKENPTSRGGDGQRMRKGKGKVPTPQELISHYEAQGMDSQQASFKVIDDLQKMLFRVISSSSGDGGGGGGVALRKDRLQSQQTVSRKMDSAIGRLAVVEMKVDSKPGYPAVFALGIASGAALKGIESLVPHVVSAFAHIWGAVGSLNNHRRL